MAEDERTKGINAAQSAEDPSHGGPRFEEAFARLEEVVGEMERGELPLEALLTRFEEGVGLVRQCREFLKQAQLRVDRFVEHKDGQWILKEND